MIIAVDPGPDKGAFVLWDGKRVRTAGWVAVTERLPPDNVAVLVNHDSGGVEMAFREGWRWNISHAGVSVPDCSYTHWMPLPKPPGGEVE